MMYVREIIKVHQIIKRFLILRLVLGVLTKVLGVINT